MSKRKDFCDLTARQQHRRIVNLTNEEVNFTIFTNKLTNSIVNNKQFQDL